MNVRASSDYVPAMIEIAGGNYIFEDISEPGSKRSAVGLTMEEFYNAAVNADYLVYNATIDDPIYTIDELIAKDPLFADFKAVQNGNVWCTGKYLFPGHGHHGQPDCGLQSHADRTGRHDLPLQTRIGAFLWNRQILFPSAGRHAIRRSSSGWFWRCV